MRHTGPFAKHRMKEKCRGPHINKTGDSFKILCFNGNVIGKQDWKDGGQATPFEDRCSFLLKPLFMAKFGISQNRQGLHDSCVSLQTTSKSKSHTIITKISQILAPLVGQNGTTLGLLLWLGNLSVWFAFLAVPCWGLSCLSPQTTRTGQGPWRFSSKDDMSGTKITPDAFPFSLSSVTVFWLHLGWQQNPSLDPSRDSLKPKYLWGWAQWLLHDWLCQFHSDAKGKVLNLFLIRTCVQWDSYSIYATSLSQMGFTQREWGGASYAVSGFCAMIWHAHLVRI